MTDVYEFTKSCLPQGVGDETPYSSKQWGYLQDLNNGSYTSGSGLSMVQFDLSSIYNSTKLIDPSQCYFAIPITYATAYTNSSNTTLLPPTGGNWASTGLKSGYFQLVQGLDLTIAGKTVEQFVPNLNQYVGFKMLSQMSQDDLKTIGASIGMGEYIDNWESMTYTGAGLNTATGSAVNALTPTAVGNGIANNTPFSLNIPVVSNFTTAATAFTNVNAITVQSITGIAVGQIIVGAGIPPSTTVLNISTLTLTLSQNVNMASVASTGVTVYFYNSNTTNFGDQTAESPQFSGSYNNGYFSRLKRIPDTTVAGAKNSSNMYGNTNCITSASNLAKEFRPYYTVTAGNIAVWYDIAIIRCCDLLDSMKQLPLCKKWDAQIRLYLNVGSVVSNITQGGLQVTSGSSITFTNTCPLLQSALSVYPNGAATMVSALWIGSPTTTSISTAGGSINLANGLNSHFMNACRFIYPQIELKPEKLDMYISSNRAKKICFTSVLNNNFNNISSGSTNSYLVQSGVSNIRGLLIIPSLSSASNGTITSNNYISAFFTYPMTSSPISLINLQVSNARK